MKVNTIQTRSRKYYVIKVVYLNPNSGYDEIHYLNKEGDLTGDILKAEVFEEESKARKQALIIESTYCGDPNEDYYKVYVQEVVIQY